MSYPRLKGKVVLVTGASAGIARRVEKLEKLKKEIESTHKDVKVYTCELDVQKNGSVEQMVKSIPQELQAVDILVNNAGLALGFNPTAHTTLEQIDTMIDTNVKGVMYMIRAIVPGMMERKSGHIINIGSIAGFESYANGSVYCASKAAVKFITEALRKELVATPLRVSSVNPGLVETEFSIVRFNGDSDKAKKPYEGLQPLVAEDIADTIVYVASRPPHVQIADLLIFPTSQASAGVIHREAPK